MVPNLRYWLQSNASPGRFFAVNEVKLLAARVLLRYDIKAFEAERPRNDVSGTSVLPNSSASILFRRRK